MAKIGTMTLTGKSGKSYEFAVYSRDTSFKELGAVYLQSKRTVKAKGGGSHEFIYIGETGDLSKRPLNHERKPCFDKHGSNCVSIYLESNEQKRLDIETDLRRAYDPPCNRQ